MRVRAGGPLPRARHGLALEGVVLARLLVARGGRGGDLGRGARAEPVEESPQRTAAAPEGASPAGAAPKRKRRFRIPAGIVVALVLLAMVLGGFWLATQAVYFVGTDADRGNTVTIYRGLPVDLPLGLKLYSRYQGSGVTLQSIPATRRKTFTDHKLRSKDDAENLVIQLERGQLDS